MPENYQNEFVVFYTFDRPGNNQQRVIYANEQAASLAQGEDFPYGSILVMETYSAQLDADGKPLLDESGRFMRDELRGIFVMRKEQGFGEAYEHLRTGEWEYVAFRPDGSYQTPPEGTHTCAFCHQAATRDRDWVFRLNLAFEEDRFGTSPFPAPNEVLIDSMSFSPRTLTVKVGTTVTWTNHDVVPHTTTSNDGVWDSGALQPGDEFSFTFNEPGTFNYFCSMHPAQMRAAIEATP
ncbi:MAG: cytochrome P460 family protein [Ardenticatenaceae bacterium]